MPIATIFSGISAVSSTINTLLNLKKTFSDIEKWQEEIKLVDNNFIELSKKEGRLENAEYRWSVLTKIETRILEGKYEVVYLADESKKLRYKLQDKSGSILLRKKVL